MNGWQIAALVFAILLLLPGGCFLVFGIGLAMDAGHDRIAAGIAPVLLAIATVILSLMGLLFWLAFRSRRPPAPPQV